MDRVDLKITTYDQCSFINSANIDLIPTMCWALLVQFSSVQSLTHVQLFVTPWTAAHKASLSITNSRNSCLSWGFHTTISSFVVPFSCLQSFPASGSFPMSHFFPSGGQSIRVSSSASVLPMNIQD